MLGSFVLTETMERHPDLGFGSYDRFFPNQDTLPHGGDSSLEEFLFGASRIDLALVRTPLWEIQERRCFYCGRRIGEPSESHVDHFIPWARYQENGLSNLVVADISCNGYKRDFLAAVEHADRRKGPR